MFAIQSVGYPSGSKIVFALRFATRPEAERCLNKIITFPGRMTMNRLEVVEIKQS